MGFRTEGGRRRLVIAATALFAVSTVFPIVASLVPAERVARWAGILDVALAAVLLVSAAAITYQAQTVSSARVQAATCAFHRGAWNVPLFLLVVFFVAGDRVRWNVLLPGLAWRAWLLATTFRSAASLWMQNPADRDAR